MDALYSENLNHGRFETWSQQPGTPFHHTAQVHGTDIVSLTSLPCEADGLIVSWEDLDRPLAIKTADCLPVVIEGDKGAIFLHVGWKGLALGILDKADIAGIEPRKAFIGPSIHACCFEVSQDFRENFPYSNLIRKDDKFFFDLQAEAKRRLNKKFPDLLIEDSGVCTCCNRAFHSYRRDKTVERNWNLYIKGSP